MVSMERRDGLFYKNVLATYSHLHAVGSERLGQGLIGTGHSL